MPLASSRSSLRAPNIGVTPLWPIMKITPACAPMIHSHFPFALECQSRSYYFIVFNISRLASVHKKMVDIITLPSPAVPGLSLTRAGRSRASAKASHSLIILSSRFRGISLILIFRKESFRLSNSPFRPYFRLGCRDDISD